jgi:hypothetical protein
LKKEYAGIARLVTATVLLTALSPGAFGRMFAHTWKADSQSSNRSGITWMEATGFYCNVNALTKAERERHKELSAKLAEARLETVELPDGFSFRLQGGRLTLPELAEWISAESKCCPFFDFEIQLERENGPLWLKLRGKEGVKRFIRSEFNIR